MGCSGECSRVCTREHVFRVYVRGQGRCDDAAAVASIGVINYLFPQHDLKFPSL